MYLMSYANNNGADQPAHPRSIISAFVVRCLYSIISLDSMAEISKLQLASVAAQTGLCLGWSETPEDTFSHSVAHIEMKPRIENNDDGDFVKYVKKTPNAIILVGSYPRSLRRKLSNV